MTYTHVTLTNKVVCCVQRQQEEEQEKEADDDQGFLLPFAMKFRPIFHQRSMPYFFRCKNKKRRWLEKYNEDAEQKEIGWNVPLRFSFCSRPSLLALPLSLSLSLWQTTLDQSHSYSAEDYFLLRPLSLLLFPCHMTGGRGSRLFLILYPSAAATTFASLRQIECRFNKSCRFYTC
jgi:hypothetical protein